MLVDHIGYIGRSSLPRDSSLVPLLDAMHAIGRIAMPLFIFMIAEGCKHTHDIKKYFKSLAIFALISEIPFNIFYALAFGRRKFEGMHFFDWSHQSVFLTLALGVLTVIVYKKLISTEKKPFVLLPVIARKLLAFIPALVIAYLSDFFNTDYGWMGVLGIFLLFMLNNKYLQMLVIVLFIVVSCGLSHPVNVIVGCTAIIPVFFYNGKRGRSVNKWAFYWFYPMHLAAISMVWLLFISGTVTQWSIDFIANRG